MGYVSFSPRAWCSFSCLFLVVKLSNSFSTFFGTNPFETSGDAPQHRGSVMSCPVEFLKSEVQPLLFCGPLKHCQALMFDLLGKASADQIAKETVGNPVISG